MEHTDIVAVATNLVAALRLATWPF